MEKNQHNNSAENAGQQSESTFSGSQPGQQLPANAEQIDNSGKAGQEEKEQHSESSFPRQEGETLGTP